MSWFAHHSSALAVLAFSLAAAAGEPPGTRGILDPADLERRPADAVQLIGPDGHVMIPEGEPPGAWVFADGVLTASPAWDSVVTPESYRDFRLHVEFNVNDVPDASDRETNGNSGVYLQQRYEVQILNSFGVPEEEITTGDGGSLYRLKKPDQLANKPAGEWQHYDIVFRAARFEGDEKTENARITVFQNGVLIHDDYPIPRKTGAGKPEGPEPRPILLQGHRNPVRFRNFWIQRLSLDAKSRQEPVIPGLHGNHPLGAARSGDILISELRCAACHEGMSEREMKQAPVLADVGSRLTPDFIKRFIADPASAHPGTTMPDLLGGETPAKRREIAESIAAYLISLQPEPPPRLAAEIPEHPEAAGSEVFHSIGCVACHSPRDEAGNEIHTPGAVPLGHLHGKYLPGALAEFLHSPLKVRPSGRMPDMKLTREEAAVLAAFLGGPPSATRDEPAAEADLIDAGRRAFERYHCTSCHQPEDAGPAAAAGPPLDRLDLGRGCLSETPGSAPDFRLADSQRQAIRQALAEPRADRPAADRIREHLTRLNCISCHVRDDFGGVAPHLDGYFTSTEEALGNESRIPPPLTLIGAKLRPEWMTNVLNDGLSVRPYMTTRMPLFGQEALAGLAELFSEADHLPPVALAGPDQHTGPEVRNAAHQLLGDTGLNCIACHNFNGKESPGMKGLDIMTSYQRLQPAWFYQFMKTPAAFRPGIIMPSYWPDGAAVQTEILAGDTEAQLEALWHFLSLGHSARDPSGLRVAPTVLEVTDAPMTYRGRSNVAGYRGIAVGFPAGIHYAFDAQNGALSAIWQGGFVNVGWQGQGSGNFAPVGKPLQLAQDVAFLRDFEPAAPWPARPRTSDEQPVNPDPLYPKNHGYRFIGYALDDASIPTFQYGCGPLVIHDRTIAAAEEGATTLHRTLRITSPADDTVWFRVLTGAIEAESATTFVIPGLKLVVDSGTVHLRRAADDSRELLLELALPEGESTLSLHYEPLR